MSGPLAKKAPAQDKWITSTKINFINVNWKDPAYYYAKQRRQSWAAIFWEGRAGATESTIDWGCPKCRLPIHADHSNIRRCPRCGLAVGEQPIIKENSPTKISRKEWKEWWGNLELEQENGSIRDQDGTQTQRKAPRKSRASSGAKRKI